MITTKVWTLKHLATGKFMPMTMFKNSGRGWSHWNPLTDEQGFNQNPRVFFSEKAAVSAKTQWTRGAFIRSQGQDTSYFDAPEPYDETHVKDMGRSKSDLEIIEGEITWQL